MHFEWNNAEKLSILVKEEKWEELGKEFVKSELVGTYKYSLQNYGSAFFVYKTVCKVLMDNGMYDTLTKVQAHAISSFAKQWDVNSLQRIEINTSNKRFPLFEPRRSPRQTGVVSPL